MQQKSCALNEHNDLFGTMKVTQDGIKSFDWITYGEFNREVQKFRNVLVHHNIEKGDNVAVIANNRVEWAVACYACNGVGAAIVPMYEAQLEKDWTYIIDDSSSKLVIAANESIYDKVKHYVGKIGKVQRVLCLDIPDDREESYNRWMRLVEEEEAVPPIQPSPEDLAVIIYTSGTTGNPKGVELTHQNICSNLLGLKDLWAGELSNNRSLAFLPWAHVYGQTAELHSLIACGSSMGIISNRDYILESLHLVKPTMILSVPALFNRVYDGVMKTVSEGTILKQILFNKAMKSSREFNERKEFGRPINFWLKFKHAVFEKLVFRKVRDKLGGNLRFMTAGGAAVNLKVLQFFEDIGIPICEGYGLTETSPVITSSANNWETRRLGCVGVPLAGIDVKIISPDTGTEMAYGEDGEICCSGPNVMRGYRNNEAANDEVFFILDEKRFFRTGDLGKIVDGKFLKVTGRIKEQFKLLNGKYVVPAVLEDQLCRSKYVSQALLYGDNKDYCVALIVPDMNEINAWAIDQGITCPNDDELMKIGSTKAMISKELLYASSEMKNFERPEKWIFTLEAFTQENQFLTPKMSLRRNNILRAYESQIDKLYNQK